MRESSRCDGSGSLSDWSLLSDELQLALSREALRRATEIIAGQAEALAGEVEAGRLQDRGGAEALRLLAAIIRLHRGDWPVVVGHA
jgi:hypothetical protein